VETTPLKPNPKETFNPHSVVIVFPTFYRNWNPAVNRKRPNADSARGDASISTITKAISAGYRLVIVDGGSSDSYLEKINELGIVPLRQEGSTMVSAKNQALEVAAGLGGADTLLLTQPEKDDVIKDISQLINPIISDQADLVVASREHRLFEQTYPAFQFLSESWANKWCNKIAHLVKVLPEGVDLDWFFGVKVLKNDRELVKMFMERYTIDDRTLAARKNLDPERYSNSDFFPILAALTGGKRVVNVRIPFHYPENQKQMEEALADQFMEKRRSQRQSILAEFVQYARMLTGNSKNHLVRAMEQESQNFRPLL